MSGQRKHVMTYLAEFLFPPQRAAAPVAMLSGGERNRLLLARLFAQPVNLLVLDEPTNDLDIESLELLESTLQDYAGTLLLVSHDRRFLDNVVTQTLVADGDGRWTEYAGGYSDWVALRPKNAATAQPVASSAPRDAPTAMRTARAKLTFKEQRELSQLPAEIEALEREQQALSERMSAADYHRCRRRCDARRSQPRGRNRTRADREVRALERARRQGAACCAGGVTPGARR